MEYCGGGSVEGCYKGINIYIYVYLYISWFKKILNININII